MDWPHQVENDRKIFISKSTKMSHPFRFYLGLKNIFLLGFFFFPPSVVEEVPFSAEPAGCQSNFVLPDGQDGLCGGTPVSDSESCTRWSKHNVKRHQKCSQHYKKYIEVTPFEIGRQQFFYIYFLPQSELQSCCVFAACRACSELHI